MHPITIDEAKSLTVGTILYHTQAKDSKGNPQKWRVFGKPQTWKRDTNRVSVPLKHGLYTHSTLTEKNLYYFSLTEE